MNIAVVGSDGQLGSDIVARFHAAGDSVLSLTHRDIEISNLESARGCLTAVPLDIIVNTAAMHHVENCENAPDKAFAVNAIGVRNLAIVTRDVGATLIHISTDYVFDGRKREPYVENDAPLPMNVYGNSKLAGEYLVRALNPKHFVLRTSALYGKHPCRAKAGLNFVELMLKLGRERGLVRVVDNEVVSPTPTLDVAEQVCSLSRSNAYGLYHATAEGSCSWYEFAREIFLIAGLNAKVEIARPGEFPAKVPRPSYSVLENQGLKKHGLNCFVPWQAGLRQYLSKAEPAYIHLSA